MTAFGTQTSPVSDLSAPHMQDGLLVHLLHALNQPLTGLQCSLELAAASARPPAEYVRTLREGLDLVSRARDLVAAIRELTQASCPQSQEYTTFPLDDVLRETACELRPVAESRNVCLRITAPTSLPITSHRHRLAALLFRLVESILGLCPDGSEVRIVAAAEHGSARLTVTWVEGVPPEHSPFSRPELGLMIARAGWEQAGGIWTDFRHHRSRTSILQMPCPLPTKFESTALGADL